MQDVIVVTQYYAPEKLGTAFYTHDLARGLQAWARTAVITGEPYYPEYQRFPEFDDYVPTSVMDGIVVRRIRTLIPKAGSAFWRLLSDVNFLLRGVARFRSQIRRHDHVVSFTPGLGPVFLGALLRSRSGRHIAIVHDIQSGLAANTGLVGSASEEVLERLEAFALNRATSVAALSPQMCRLLIDMGVKADKIFLLPIWLRDDIWSGHEASEELSPVPTICYSGVVAGKQNLSLLKDIVFRLETEARQGVVLVRGAGPNLAGLLRTAEDWPRDRLQLESLVEEHQLPSALSDSWLHVIPQRTGTAAFSVPSKVLNALASGRPVVVETERDSPMHDLSRACEAVVVTHPGETPSLTDVTMGLLDAPAEIVRLGKLGRRYVREAHSRDFILRQLVHRLQFAT